MSAALPSRPAFQVGQRTAALMRQRPVADAATMGAIVVVVMMIVPARLVVAGLPFDLTPVEGLGLFCGLWWFCAHFTTTLGAAKGRTLVRNWLYFYGFATLVTYTYGAASFLPEREVSLLDHGIVISIAMMGLSLILCDGLRTVDRIDFVLKTLVVCGAVIGVIGAIQFFLSIDPTLFITVPGTRVRDGLAEAIIQRGGLNRVSATTTHPIEFGVVSAMILPIGLHYAFTSLESKQPSLRWWACCALIGIGMVLSGSRSPMVGLAVSGVVLFIGWNMRRRIMSLIGFACFTVAMIVAAPGVIGTVAGLFLNAGTDESVRWRTNDYPLALDAIRESPILGRGIGTWFAPDHVIFDNQYLLTFVEGGIVGILAFFGLFFVAAWACLRAWRLTTDSRVRDLALTLAAALAVPLVGCATFDLRSFGTANTMSFLLVGVAGALLRAVVAQRRAAETV